MFWWNERRRSWRVKITMVGLKKENTQISHRTWIQPCTKHLCCLFNRKSPSVSEGRTTRLSLIGGQPGQGAAGRSLDLSLRGCRKGSWELEGGGWGGGVAGWRGEWEAEAAAGWGGAAGSEPVVGGAAADGAERAWPGGRAAGGEGAGGGRRKRRRCWTSPGSVLKKNRRWQEMHLRSSPDPVERRGGGATITSHT